MEIFKLFGSILVDNEPANKSLDSTDKKAQGTGKNLGALIGTAAKVGVGIATGVAAGTAALWGMAQNAADVTSNIKDAADRAGTTAENFQKLKYAAEMSGMSVEGLEKAMIKQQKAFADASEGEKIQSEAYKRLGINIKEVGSSSEAFDLVIARLADMENETEKNALANDIFGRTYAELTPLLNEGGEGIEALKQKAVDLGLVMSNESVAAGEEFGDALETLQQSFSIMASKIGVEVLPIIQTLVDWVLGHMPEIQTVTSKVFGAIGTVVSATGDIIQKYLLPTMESIWEWVQPYLPQIQAFFQDVFQQVSEALQGFMVVVGEVIEYVKQWFAENEETVNSLKELFFVGMEYIKTVITTVIAIISYLWSEYGDNLMNIAKKAWDYVMSVFKTAIDLLTGIYKIFTALLKGDWEGVWKAIQETASKTWENLKNVFEKYIGALKSLIDLGLKYMSNAFSGIFGGIKNIVGGIFDGIVSNIKNSINTIVKAVNFMIQSLNKIKIKIPEVDIPLVGKVGGKTIGLPNIKELPLLAQGGHLMDNGAAIVGEAGPEIISGMKGAKVTPIDKAGITLNFYDTKIMSDRDIDILGERLTKRLKVLGV